MTNTPFKKLVQEKNESLRGATTDFDVDKHIRDFNSLPVEAQKRIIRRQLRQTVRQESLQERLRVHKGWKAMRKFFAS